MFTIFKWFFGIVGLILFAYVVILIVRYFLTFTASKASTIDSTTTPQTVASTTTSIKDWFLALYQPMTSPRSVGTDGNSNSPQSVEKDYHNPLADKLLSAYSDWNIDTGNSDDFDARWGGTSHIAGDNTSTTKGGKPTRENPSGQTATVSTSLPENSVIRNNQIITGIAPKGIYVDKVFPIFILDKNKKVIGTIKAFTNGDATKTGYIPYRGVLSFSIPTTNTGYLMLNDDTQIVPVYFNTAPTSALRKMPSMIFNSPVSNSTNGIDGCVIGGCSMQFCVEQRDVTKIVSSCEYLPAYACYRKAVCGRDPNSGKCGWKIDNELASCLQNSY